MPSRILRSSRGFSLVEMAVVFVVVGIAVAVIIPNFQRSFARTQSDRAMTELQTDIRLAMSTAKARGRAVRITFNGNGYTIMDTADSTTVQSRMFGSHIAFDTDGASPLVFPWGMVQPANITIEGKEQTRVMSLLPTGRLECQGG